MIMDSQKNRGYTLLFAVLTATLVLSVTVFIVSISRKQFILASSARESTYSIYAASSGLECALVGQIARYTYDDDGEEEETNVSISCNGTTKNGNWSSFNTPQAGLQSGEKVGPLKFRLGVGGGGGGGGSAVTSSCVHISVFYGEGKLIVESRGYNLCTSGSNPDPETGPRIVERVFRYTIE